MCVCVCVCVRPCVCASVRVCVYLKKEGQVEGGDHHLLHPTAAQLLTGHRHETTHYANRQIT